VARKKNRYVQIIEHVFDQHYKRDMSEFEFTRAEFVAAAQRLKIDLPKNLGDLPYTFRYRLQLPASIAQRASADHEWIIRPAGRSRYRFVLIAKGTASITPSTMLAETKVLDSTPGVIAAYALSDEQALLAKLRYNRLIDIFTGLTCYSLQNHLRTTAPSMGQVETDEIYIGMDKRGVHFVLPVQGKGGRDKVGAVQIEQDMAVCLAKFPALICRPIAAQFMADDLIALFAFDLIDGSIKVVDEKHYRLVRPDQLSAQELRAYQGRQA
jgi:hypothetical protein